MTQAPVTTIEEAAKRYHSGDAGRLAVIAQAKDEHRQRKADLAAGGEPTATPALDFINTKPEEKKMAATRAPKAEPTVRLYRRGNPMPDRHNNLSALAFQATATKDTPRWKTEQLRAWLAQQGIADPMTTSWEATLPNGVVIAARPLGASVPAAKVRAPRPTTTKGRTATPAKGDPAPAKAPRKRTAKKAAAKVA